MTRRTVFQPEAMERLVIAGTMLLLRPEYRYHLSPTPFRLVKWRIATYHAGIAFMDIR